MSDMRRRAVGEMQVLSEGRARGYVTTFGDPYEYAPRVREEITPDTFDLSRPVPVMYQHNHDDVPVGVMTLARDDKGIIGDTQFFMDTDRGRAAYAAMSAGAVREWSVGFTAKPGDITTTRADGYVHERIDKGDLLEVSVVLRGANPHTSVIETRADYGNDPGAAAPGGRDKDTHEVPLSSGAPSFTDAMAVMAGALKQLNNAHDLVVRAHAGVALPDPASDDTEDEDEDSSGPIPQDPAAASGAALRKDYSAEDRKEMAKKGTAMPDGSFPIANEEDLHNAIRLYGNAKDPAAAKQHIIDRAKAMGLEAALPESWGVNSRAEDSEYRDYLYANLDKAWAREAMKHLS